MGITILIVVIGGAFAALALISLARALALLLGDE